MRRSSKNPPTWPATEDHAPPPNWWSVMLEARAFVEWGAGWLVRPWAAQPSPNPQEPVLVLPGLLTDDWAMSPLVRSLTQSGYTVLPWDEGINMGPDDAVMDRLRVVIRTAAKKHKRRVHLVGWSLGGAMAWALAHDEPRHVASVVALGAPLRARADASNLKEVFSWASGMTTADEDFWRTHIGRAPLCPATSIVSQTDGLVGWQSSVAPRAPTTETILVRHMSHLGMPASPLASWLMLNRLAAAQTTPWRPFRPKGWMTRLAKTSTRVRS